jgi:hypothetical protein
MYTKGHFLVLGNVWSLDGWKYFVWILQGTFFLDFNCKSALIMIQSQEIGDWTNPLDGYHMLDS